jgi:putative Mg2+ transporter-C (MgtC) family protein
MMQLQIIGEVAIAILLGSLIGYDRELANRPAGLRTHMFVAGAAALLVSLGDIIIGRLSVDTQLVSTDPIRLIEAVITGVSFLGAGTIIQRRKGEQIEGLTTAASLLFVAAIGVCVALSQFILAVGVTALSLVILKGVRALEIRFNMKSE